MNTIVAAFLSLSLYEGLNMRAKHRIVGVDDNQMDGHLIPGGKPCPWLVVRA